MPPTPILTTFSTHFVQRGFQFGTLAVTFGASSLTPTDYSTGRGGMAKFTLATPVSASSGSVTVRVDDKSARAQSVSFDYTYLPADEPLLTHLSPADIIATGGTDLQVDVDKLDYTVGFNVSLCGVTMSYPYDTDSALAVSCDSVKDV